MVGVFCFFRCWVVDVERIWDSQLLRSHLGSVILGWCCVLVDGGGWLRIICSARAFAKVGILVLGIGGPVRIKAARGVVKGGPLPANPERVSGEFRVIGLMERNAGKSGQKRHIRKDATRRAPDRVRPKKSRRARASGNEFGRRN